MKAFPECRRGQVFGFVLVVARMKDRQALLAEASHKRDLAAFVRRVAATMSLSVDREALMAQAATIEAEADKIERDAHG